MSLTIEWRNRIEHWRREIKNHFYRPLGAVEMTGFTTLEQLSAETAMKGDFQPMPPGTKWGKKWEYGWFQGAVTLPPEAAGKRIVLRVDAGGESAVYVNGRSAGAVDSQHREITLSTNGVAGAQYGFLVEAYGGHGPMVCGVGPVAPDRVTVPEPPETQREVGTTSYGIWEEEAYQLWLDVETLIQVRDNVDADSLRVAEIDQALRDYTVIVDFECAHDEMMATMRAARERLAPLLACTNGSTAPTLFAYGHSHIDVAWLWPLAETERKCVRTFATQLALAEEYPEFKFLQSQPHLYRMVKTGYPKLYERVKKAVAEGRFIAEGGMWVEADTNVSGGESLIRQFIHGKRFYREEFGVECKMLWLPDVFGYSGALPQIMRGCGIKYFATAKIFWNYNGGDPFPYNTFTWEGIDGSGVLVHLCNDYNSHTMPANVIRRWTERVQKDGFSTRLFPFGFGDGGGGPTRDHLEFLRRQKDLEGVPRTRIDSPIRYFEDQEAKGLPEARYVGELYYQCHRGTYTTQAKTKKGNRVSELALREAEMWGAAASALKGYAFPKAEIDEAWKAVLLNQFHDIIPGSSIHRVYEEAEAAYKQVIQTARRTANAAASALTDGSEGALTVFNSLSWKRSELVPLPDGLAGAESAKDGPLPAQKIAGGSFVEVNLPPCGWTSLKPAAPVEIPNNLQATATLLENELLRIEFNEKGEITSLFDKQTGREFAQAPCNSFRMYKDVPTNFDAWDIDSMYALTPVELDEPATVEVIASGPLVAILRISRKLNNSVMRQAVMLRRNSRRVDFKTSIDWQESHKLLKVCFPVTLHANEGVHEIQFGHIRRPNHKSRPFDADRFEVCNHKWSALVEENRGFAVLNDCKYGVNVDGNSLNLTLLKSPLAPDMTADKGRQEFTYAVYPWNGSLAVSNVIDKAYELNCPVMTVPGAAEERQLFSLNVPNVIIEAIKPAEDGSGDVIVRLYEAKRMTTRCKLSTTLPVQKVYVTNMLEENQSVVEGADQTVMLEFRPFEIKTLRFRI